MDRLRLMYGDPDGWSGISSSNAGAVIDCPASLALPQVRTTSDRAERGNALHEFARLVTINPNAREEALAKVPEQWRHTAAGMNLAEALDGLKVVGCERAYALDVKKRTVRFIGENIERKYGPLSRYEIPLTLDLEAFVDATPAELDYKSGKSIGEPSEHWQRKVCSTALMLLHDTPSAISRVAYIWDDGSIKPDGHEFSIFDAEDHCDTLVRAVDAVWRAREQFANGIMPTVSPTETSCDYCPAIDSCPYYLNFARSMVGRLKEIVEGPDLDTLSGDDLLKAWEDAKLAAKLAEEIIDKRLKPLAKQQPFGNDKYEVSPKTQSKTYFDDSAARGLIVKLLSRLGHDDEQITEELSKLVGKSEYPVYTKRKRRLDIVA